MMKKIFVFLFTTVNLVFAQGVNFDWAGSAGQNNSYHDHGRCVKVDNFGNILVAGIFSGTVDFDFGAGISNLTSNSYYGSYVVKYSPAGALIWAKKFDHTTAAFTNEIKAMTIDASGNIIIAGNFPTSMDINPGPVTNDIYSAGANDLFVIKLDNNGDLIWGKRIGGNNHELTEGVGIDNTGAIYLTGYFSGTSDFDPGAGVFNETATGSQSGFLLKLTSDGNFRWVNAIKGTQIVFPQDLDVDNNANTIIVGSFNGTVDFDPTIGVNNIVTNGSDDLFFQRVDSTGIVQSTLRLGSTSIEFDCQIVCLNNGDKIWSGSFNQVMDLDPGVGTVMSDPSGTFANAFIIKLDMNDVLVEHGELVGASSNAYRSVDVARDNVDGIYWYGKYIGATADLDPTTGNYVLPSSGFSWNQFIIKIDTAWSFQWAKQLEGIYSNEPSELAVNNTLDLYATGSFMDTMDFDPSIGVHDLVSNGGYDMFLLKLKNCSFTYDTLNVTACFSYTSPNSNITYYTSGTYIDYLTNSTNCDSILTIQLTIGNSQYQTINETICNPNFYSSPSGNYQWNLTGTYYDTIPTVLGCDSILTINLTANAPQNSSISVDVCSPNTYTSPSGFFTWSSTGTYYDTIPTFQGCDSVIQINLSVYPFNLSVTQHSMYLSSDQSSAGSYQWIDCNNGNAIIPGANSQDFYPTTNGSYAVIITNGCVDTSNCITFEFFGIEESLNSSIILYPNPTSDFFKLNIPSDQIISVEVIGVEGRVLLLSAGVNMYNIQALASGNYYVRIKTKDGVETIKLIKM